MQNRQHHETRNSPAALYPFERGNLPKGKTMTHSMRARLTTISFVFVPVVSACAITDIAGDVDAGSVGGQAGTGGSSVASSVGGATGTGGTSVFVTGGPDLDASLGTGGTNATATAVTFVNTRGDADTCTTTPSRMPMSVFALSAATAPDGQIYLFGGSTEYETASSTAPLVIYDPANDSYSSLASLAVTIEGIPALAFAGGKLVAADGYGLWLYDPSTNVWSTGKAPSAGYYNRAAATGPDGRVYFFGGLIITSGGISNSADVYDPTTDSWSSLPPMPFPGDAAAATTSGGKIYIAGAYAAVYDPTQAKWSQLPSPPTPRYWLNAVTDAQGRILTIGGSAGGTPGESGAVEIFDPATGSWTKGASLPVPVGESASATACGGNRVFVFGGDSGQIENLVQAYGPGDHWWLSP